MIPIILSVAGSDCSGGAGIQADIKTISALHGYAASVITAVTAQNTLGVQAVFPMTAHEVDTQLQSVLSDLHPQSVKIGMLPQADTICTLAQALRQWKVPYVVCDPVMISTSGRRLMAEDAVQALKEELFPLCTLITPNLHEAAFLSETTLNTVDEMKQEAQHLSALYRTSLLIKGGHLEGDTMCDILYHRDTAQCHAFSSKKIPSNNLHGTGCTLSSAIATYLAYGLPLPQAVQKAKDYMNAAIAQGKDLHIGQGNGPLWHFIE